MLPQWEQCSHQKWMEEQSPRVHKTANIYRQNKMLSLYSFYPQAALVSWWVTLCSDSSWTGLQCQILKEPGKEITIFKVSFNYILRIFETSNCIGKKSLQTTTSSHHHILHWQKKYHSKAAHVGHALGICCSREHLLALMKVSWSVHESLFAGF